MAGFDAVAALLDHGVRERLYPAACVETGTSLGPAWRCATGGLTYEPDASAATPDTVFDLASLTKVIATTSLLMRHVEGRGLSLADRVARRSRFWSGADRALVTVRDLLEHCAGLTAWLPFYRDASGRVDVEAAIGQGALEYPPWTRSVYSDLGFLLLGFIVEDAGGAPLAEQVEPLLGPLGIRYAPPAEWKPRVAPTEVDPWRGRLLQGEVHDENAWMLGGAAGHAGLFGTVGAVGTFARLVLETFGRDTALAHPATLARFVTRSTVPRSSRALGWDTMLPTSSCGTRMSSRAIGHTGFTGTSLWIDPATDRYVVLLTNRVHPSREPRGFAPVRARIHDAIAEVMEPRAR
jgi:CubicO group peptidase (beta-lactamase class C family)